MYPEQWTSDRARELEELRGRIVESFVGLELAIVDHGRNGLPQFDHPNVPCLQLSALYAKVQDSADFEIQTYQNNTHWGLHLTAPSGFESRAPDYEAPDSIYRVRALNELPSSLIENVTVRLDARGNISEVLIRIGSGEVVLVAGSVDGTTFVKGDDEVLVFGNAEDARDVRWAVSEPGSSFTD